MPLPPPPLSDHDYDAIEAAVVETARGRWFLSEYARRNRHADTKMLIAALDRIEAAMRGESAVQSVDRIRFDLLEMAKAIARTKTEVAAIEPPAQHHGKFADGPAELDCVIRETEVATANILAAAESIQETSWSLREQGLDAGVCDRLDAKAAEISAACSSQDLTTQRTQKAIAALGYLEGRINSLIDVWGLDGAAVSVKASREPAPSPRMAPEPDRSDKGAKAFSSEVDTSPHEENAAAHTPPAIEAAPPDLWHRDAANLGTDIAVRERPEVAVKQPKPQSAMDWAPAPQPVSQPSTPPVARAIAVRETATAAAQSELGPMARAMGGASDPLAAIAALSLEEKIALFT